jgi:hypothetical protein
LDVWLEGQVGDESYSQSSAVIPGAITALLREAFRSPRPPEAGLSGLRPGMVVGRFELVRKLGRGGFGVVFEAIDRTLGRAVAFKAVRMAGDVDVNAEMLLREAEAAAQLSHPNIVVLHDLGQCEQGPYLVMELLRGRTLVQRIEEGPIPLAEALHLSLEMAKGVAHAHARHVVHRDLKPGNVFLCEDGQVKVLDFGMARMFGRPKVEGGTVAYMAPEQRRGEPEDERTDVFALGVMLHEMLVGVRPPEAQVSAGSADALATAGAGKLSPLVARMLSPDPGERPRDGGEVLAALKAAERKVRAGRVSRTRIYLRASTVVAAVAAAALVASRAARELLPAPRAEVSAPPVGAVGPPQAPEPPRPPAPAPSPPPAAVTSAPAVVSTKRPPARRAIPATAPVAVPAAAPVAVRAPALPPVRYCRGGIESVPTPRPESGLGVLVILADPFAEVFVDGQAFGDTPTECALTAGAHTARAAHPRYGSREARVEVKAGERTRFAADFLDGR